MSLKIYGIPEKPIYTTSLYRAAYGYQDANGKVVSKENVLGGYNWNGVIFLKSSADLKAEVDKVTSALGQKETLYFDDTSSFPRFKLNGSPFKRCIKLDKATKVIVSDSVLDQLKEGASMEAKKVAKKFTLIDDPDYYIVVENDNYYLDKVINNYGSKGDTILDVFKKYGVVSKKATYLHDDYAVQATPKHGECLINILTGTYKSIVFDKTLDKNISRSMESFDSESLDSIREMLGSADKAIVDMGLKLIPNYNVMEYKLSLNTMISLNYRKCQSSKVWQSTAIKQLKETINFEDPYSESFPGCIEKINRKENYTEDDVNYAKALIVEATRTRLSSLIDGLAESVKTYNIKINADVQ